MQKFLFSALWMILLLSACNQKAARLETIETTDRDGYIERYSRRTTDYAKEGLYVRTDPRGTKVEEAEYRNDTLNGRRTLYYETGDLQVVETYRMGLFDGAYEVYYPGGQVKLAGQYTANVMSGIWRGYYANGQLKEEVTFADNAENGPFTEYHPNGQLKAVGTYLNGDNEHGELKLYDENGQHEKTMLCDKGTCRTVWSSEKQED
ncbi:MAG TPA: toxin-antitoxin system YwqK family antitoxin [Saprospiraceae bacterium]|nr:toxin-antitoxin system YwqK family antitoxin [Saprospiraceae bacterium]HMP24371.1 toxin-antitoxin system YwqK family antitoxin [Saprospiraceae bacterium]